MIKAENLSFSYSDKKIINNLFAEFHTGELCSVIGENGSGKTTLIKLLSRFLTPNNGTIFVDAKTSSSYSQKEYAKLVSVLPQQRPTPFISVYDLVSHGRFAYLGFSRRLSKLDIEKIDEALIITDTMRFADKNIKNLSGGERQRAYIAMLLAQDTKYLLLDKPVAHLDIYHSFEIMELLKKLSASGKGIITVMHDLTSALKYSDKLLLIDKETPILFDSPDALIASKQLEKTFKIHCNCVEFMGKNEYFFTPIH